VSERGLEGIKARELRDTEPWFWTKRHLMNVPERMTRELMQTTKMAEQGTPLVEGTAAPLRTMARRA